MLQYVPKKRSRFAKRINKQILLLIGCLTIIALLPFVVYLINQITHPQIHAEASTTLSLVVSQKPTQIGDTFPVDIVMDPGTNQIGYVKVDIMYDNTQIKKTASGFIPNKVAFPSILDAPLTDVCVSNICHASIALSVGDDPTKAITVRTTVATIPFTLLSTSLPIAINFGSSTQALALGSPSQTSQNLLASTSPLNIVMNVNNNFLPPSSSPTIPIVSSITPTIALINSDVYLDLTILFPGIGLGGNTQPLHPTRQFTVSLFTIGADIHGQALYSFSDNVYYSSNTGAFTNPDFHLGNVPQGNYQLVLKTNQAIPAVLSQPLQLAPGQTTKVAATKMVTGDIAPFNNQTQSYGNGSIDLSDYNALIGCFGTNTPQNCVNKNEADLNDDGVVDGIDYNILLSGINAASSQNPQPNPTVSAQVLPTGTQLSSTITQSPGFGQ